MVLFFVVVVFVGVVLLVVLQRLPAGRSLQNTRGRTIAHRCGVVHQPGEPENSVEALRNCCAHGVDGVEVDVLVSADSVPFIFHDFSFDRLCGEPRQTYRTPWETIAGMSFLAFNSALVSGVSLKNVPPPSIPSLASMTRQVLDRDDLLFFIEIKEIFQLSLLCERLAESFQENPALYERACVISFNPWALYKIRALDPNIRTVVLIRKKPISSWSSSCPDAFPRWVHWCPAIWDRLVYWSCLSWVPWFVGASGVGFHNSIVTTEDVKNFQRRGYEVNIWVVNDEKRKQELLELGASVTTDRLFSRRKNPLEPPLSLVHSS